MLRESINLTNIPPIPDATQSTIIPFEVTIQASTSGEHVINLYAANSNSAPYQYDRTRWSNLLPQWRFTDSAGNVSNNITTTDTLVYDDSGNFIGTTGIGYFHFIDDMPTRDPLLIFATLETSGIQVSYDNEKQYVPGYSNSKVAMCIPYHVNGYDPEYLNITKDGENDINQLKWKNVEFEYVITVMGGANKYFCSNTSKDIVLFNYPSGNDIVYDINRTILTIPQSSITWNPDPQYFEHTLSDNTRGGGFAIGSVTPYASALNTAISASVTVKYNPAFRDSINTWVSNPEHRTLNKIFFMDVPAYLTSATDIPILSAFATPHTVPYTSAEGYAPLFGGILGIAVEPCGGVWAADAEQDYVYKFSSTGTLVSSIQITPQGSSPISVALDSDLNAWVTLYGANYCYKLDNNTGTILASALSPFIEDFTTTDHDEIQIRPVGIDTDTDDNVWVAYEHYLRSQLIKYDTNGTYLLDCTLPVSSQPQGVVVDGSDNSVWVTNTYEVILDPYTWSYPQSAGSIQHYDSTGTLIKSVTGLSHPSFITLDNSGNPWFTYGYCNVACISGNTLLKLSVSGGIVSTDTTDADLINGEFIGNNEQLEGISCDRRNRLWVINSVENKMYVIYVDDITNYRTFNIYPENTYVERSAQAMGDWTGAGWMRKYTVTEDPNTTIVKTITGMSNIFNIKPLINENDVRLFNESWDATSQIRSYAIPEHINQNYNIFENFFGYAIGGLLSEDQQIGRLSYEKISNFTKNHTDIDTANIDQLYSLSKSVDVPIDDYIFDYPVELRRLLNIASIDHQKLWGTRCKCNRNFSNIGENYCINCGHQHPSNLGDVIDPFTYEVTANTTFVVKPNFNIQYTIITPTTANNSYVYDLTSVASIGHILSSDYSNYTFFEHIPTFCGEQVEGCINWDDNYTLLSESLSSLTDWYGDGEILEEMFNYLLHKGLNLEK